MPKSVPPSINETAFDCPHCGAYTSQFWRKLFAARFDEDNPTPNISADEFEKMIRTDENLPNEAKQSLLKHADKLRAGKVFSQTIGKSRYLDIELCNINLSKCFNCKEYTVWVHGNIVFPPARSGAAPNPDFPEDIIADFEEARSILDLSPRGSAALLRLCVQKLCKHLGESGKNIDDDIASLVAKGLDPLVQQSLDAVRVIGNESVHPGEINLNDDRDTAARLFDLVNAIADQLISHPRNVKAIYQKLPEGKRGAIDKRNEKARKSIFSAFKGDDSS